MSQNMTVPIWRMGGRVRAILDTVLKYAIFFYVGRPLVAGDMFKISGHQHQTFVDKCQFENFFKFQM